MNKFEFEFVNDLRRLSLYRVDVCKHLGITMPTLKSRLKEPDTLTVREVVKLKQLNFTLKHLEL
jgi:hypothetical protein